MTSITRRLFLPLAAALAPGAAIAHHGCGGYDTSKSFTVTGEILKSTTKIRIARSRWRSTASAGASSWRRLRAWSGAASRRTYRARQDLHRVRLSPYQQSGRGADRIHYCRRQAHRIAVDRSGASAGCADLSGLAGKCAGSCDAQLTRA